MRLAFIGAAGHHKLAACVKKQLRPVEAVAVCGDGISGVRTADWLGDQHVIDEYPTIEALLDDFKPTVVNVGAVHAHNSEFILACLKAGAAVVSDKPIAASWQAYEHLASCVRAKPESRLITEFEFRSRPAFRAARKVVLAGEIGQVTLVTAQKSYRFGTRPTWYGQREHFGGLVLWVASHAIDFVQFCTGRSFVDVIGSQVNLGRPDYPQMEEAGVSHFTLDNGAPAVVHADYLRPAKAPTHADDRLRIMGTRGMVEIIHDRCTLTTHETEPRDITDSVTVASPAEELLAAALGESQAIYSTQASLETARVCLAARDAGDSGQRVVI